MTFQKIIILVTSFLHFSTYGLIQNSKELDLKPQDKTLFAIDLNPLILANQGLGLNTEIFFRKHTSIGASLEYYVQTPYKFNGVQATRNMINIAPFLHYYLQSPKLEGLFIGLKLNLTYSKAEIKDNVESAKSKHFFVAPTLHFGYRFVANNGFSVTAYVGGGFKSSNNRFSSSQIPASRKNNQDWKYALEKLNKNVTSLQPDFGLTVGYVF